MDKVIYLHRMTVTNQCPACMSTFRKQRGAYGHLKAAATHGR